jgi:hypothetical protein
MRSKGRKLEPIALLPDIKKLRDMNKQMNKYRKLRNGRSSKKQVKLLKKNVTL